MDTHRDAPRHPGDDAEGPPTLPFEAVAADAPVPYALTARARRVIAPERLPDLAVVPPASVVPAPVTDPDPTDPRRARARALMRAGRSVGAIASLLRVEPAAVAGWCADVRRKGDRRGVTALDGDRPQRDAAVVTARADAERTFAARRARAEAEVGTRLTGPDGTAFAAGLGFASAVADATAHVVVIRTDRAEVAAAVLAWLVDAAGAERRRTTAVIEVSPGAALDLEAQRWADALGLQRDRITATVADRPVDDAVSRATVRVADPAVAARVAGWRDGALDVLGIGRRDRARP